MCGINGFYNYSRITLSDEEALIKRMNESIEHRGPDDNGIWCDRRYNTFFGHQRLSILDLSEKGHQPMVSSKGNVIIYNGEIYNFKNIKSDLKNHFFLSETDTEVLLYLYERDGQKCLDQLNGMFAFAIWDNAKQELFLARDRIGIKPLYYTTVNGIFAFSSEIKALLTLPWIKTELDEEALYHFLTFNNVSPPQSMFKNIHKFHPGYRMVVGGGGIQEYRSYWEVSYDNHSSFSDEGFEQIIVKELERSVKDRLVSDVPVGAFLSGGVDSSAIVALMGNNTSSQIKTYSIGFKDAPGYDELEYAGKISKLFNTSHYEKIVTPQDLVDFLPKVVDIFDEPIADATSIPIYFISQLAREQGTIVVLSGDGSDELFCGYNHWKRYVTLYPYYRLYCRFPEMVRKSVACLYGMIDESSPNYEILCRAVKQEEFFWGGAAGFKESTKHSFLSNGYRERIKDSNSYERIKNCRRLLDSINTKGKRISDTDWMSFMGIKDIVPNCYLYRADRLGMANSVEIRVPFLDHNFVNLALSIPGSLKIRNGESKYILKRTLKDILPPETLYRKKRGFCVPLKEWTGQYIIQYVESNLKKFCRDTGIFREEGLKWQIEKTRKGNTDYTYTLWNIYFLMSWFKKWIL